MSVKKIKISDWLSANCPYRGCLHNDGFGTCTHREHEIIDEVASRLESDGIEGIMELENFECLEADFECDTCEFCGDGLVEIKEYLTGEKQFSPVIYTKCNTCG